MVSHFIVFHVQKIIQNLLVHIKKQNGIITAFMPGGKHNYCPVIISTLMYATNARFLDSISAMGMMNEN